MQRDTKGRTIIQSCRKEVTHHRATCCDDHVPRTGSPYNIVKSRNYNQCQALLERDRNFFGELVYQLLHLFLQLFRFIIIHSLIILPLRRNYEYLEKVWKNKNKKERITSDSRIMTLRRCCSTSIKPIVRSIISNRGSKLTPECNRANEWYVAILTIDGRSVTRIDVTRI